MKRRTFIAALLAFVLPIQAGVLIQSYRFAVAGQPEIFTVDLASKTGADFETAADGKSFLFDKNGSDTFSPWFNTGTENDPSSGTTSIEVIIGGSDGDEAIALALSGISATGWTVTVSGSLVTFTSNTNGARPDAVDVDTGCAITTTQQGSP